MNPPIQAELLSPAGNWECARAAVANGADAIYFGLPRFNARMRADNFTETDLPELMKFLHEHGVRGFVAFNVLVFTDELEAAADQIRLMANAGVDAVIVQDLGLAKMVRAIAPGIELHASTQMTISSPEGLAFLDREFHLERAVLARELSLRELKRFDGSVPLEVFVHGALCVAYSGQCLTSEALGQRSANRGECAQACRMPYELVVDGEEFDMADKRYLLSPQDLAAVDQIPELLENGVVSFKIEGRLKSPEYVAGVTQVYRKAIDAALANQPQKASDEDRYALEMTFSRGLSSGWLEGTNHPRLTHGRFGKKRGAYIGEVDDTGADWVAVDKLLTDVKPGDGIVFDTGGDTDHEEGGFVFEVHGTQLGLQRGRFDTRQIPIGAKVWKTSDPALDKALRKSYSGKLEKKRQALDFEVAGRAGEPMVLSVLGSTTSVSSEMPLEVAQKRPLGAEVLEKQLGRLGETPFELGSVTNRLEGEVMLPMSELNRMRRELVAQIEVGTAAPIVVECGEWKQLLPARSEDQSEVELTVLCRNLEQLEACCGSVGVVYCDFEDIRLYKEAVALVRESGAGTRIFLATPRIQKAGEAGYFKIIERAVPDGVLVRNLGAIDYFSKTDLELVGDFSLNVANPITADFFKTRGLDLLTVSYDLNIEQVLGLLRAAPPAWFEVTLHQHMPMFHMEHCVFCTFMSEGTDATNCGRPCEKHDVQMRDRVGQLHTLKADVGCRNTLFRGQAQTGARFFNTLREAGASRFRLELLREDAAGTKELIDAYAKLLSGQTPAAELFTRLNLESRLGVVEGTMVESR
ncbi:MAG: putative protease [Verrucomicrobiales bacterium]